MGPIGKEAALQDSIRRLPTRHNYGDARTGSPGEGVSRRPLPAQGSSSFVGESLVVHTSNPLRDVALRGESSIAEWALAPGRRYENLRRIRPRLLCGAREFLHSLWDSLFETPFPSPKGRRYTQWRASHFREQ